MILGLGFKESVIIEVEVYKGLGLGLGVLSGSA